MVSGEGHIEDGTRYKNYNVNDGLYEQSVLWARSITEWRASPALTFKNTLYYYRADRDFRNLETYRFNAGNTQVLRSGALLQRHEQRLIGNRVEGLYRSTPAGLPSDWSFGADYSVNKQTRYPTSLPGQVDAIDPYDFSPGDFYDIPGMKRGHVADRDNRIRTLAFTLENRTEVLPGLSLVSALRKDFIDVDLTNRRAVTASSPASASRSYSPLTGRLGLNWQLSPEASLYAQYATAADPPSGLMATASFADVLYNDKLTTGRQAEVGGKFDFWDGRGSATVALYDIRRKNISTPDANNPGVSLPVGEQSSRGLELASGLRLSRQVTLQANMAFVAPRYDDFSQTVNGVAVSRNGKVPTNTPRRIANVWVDYAFLPDWTASAAAHVGKTYADAANTTWAPAYMVFDAAVSHRIDRNLTVTARVRNPDRQGLRGQRQQRRHVLPGRAALVRTDAASALLRTAMSALPQTRPRAATGPSLAARAKRWLYLLHRWAGITLCLFFAMWFISGVVMMYVGYPKLTPAERLGHLAPLDPAGVTVTPAQALAAAGLEERRPPEPASRPAGGRRAAPKAVDAAAARAAVADERPPPRPRPGSGPTRCGTRAQWTRTSTRTRARWIRTGRCTASTRPIRTTPGSTSPRPPAPWCWTPPAPNAPGTTWAPGSTGSIHSEATRWTAGGTTSWCGCRWRA